MPIHLGWEAFWACNSVQAWQLAPFEQVFDIIRLMAVGGVVILGAARTPIGKFGGSFKDVHAAELGAVASRAALARSGLTASDVEEVLMGHGRPAGVGPNSARQVGHRAGVPDTAPAYTINKACASGLQAIVSAAQAVAIRPIRWRRVVVMMSPQGALPATGWLRHAQFLAA